MCVFKKWGQMGKMYSFWDLKTRRVLSEPHQHQGTPLVISTFSDTPRNLRTIKRNVLICQDLRPPHFPQRNPFPILCQRSAQKGTFKHTISKQTEGQSRGVCILPHACVLGFQRWESVLQLPGLHDSSDVSLNTEKQDLCEPRNQHQLKTYSCCWFCFF